jgi:hypothetical protein
VPPAAQHSEAENKAASEHGAKNLLPSRKATPYVTDLQAADPDNDGYFDKTEFMAACQRGLVQSAFKKTSAPRAHHIMLPPSLLKQN